MLYILTFILFLVGLYGLFTQRNLIKIIISVSIIETAVNVFLVLVGYRTGGVAPVITGRLEYGEFISSSVDPFPQAMVLTSIVIGLSVIALMVAISLRLYHVHGTYNIDEILQKSREEKK